MSGAAVSYLAASRRWLFRPWLCGKGVPQYPGDGPGAVHPIFCYVGAAAAGFSGQGFGAKAHHSTPGMGRALLFPYFVMSAQPPRAFPAMALRQGHTTVPRGWAGRCSSHILLGWRSRRWLFRPWLCGKGTPQYPGDGPGAVHPIFCWVGAAAAGFSGQGFGAKAHHSTPGMGRALLFPYFAMSAQPPRAFPAVWMRFGASLAGAAPVY